MYSNIRTPIDFSGATISPMKTNFDYVAISLLAIIIPTQQNFQALLKPSCPTPLSHSDVIHEIYMLNKSTDISSRKDSQKLIEGH